MKLEKKSLREAEEWKKAGYELPEYDLDIIQANTKKKPTWIHFGAGNIFRAFMAVAQQKFLTQELLYVKGMIQKLLKKCTVNMII